MNTAALKEIIASDEFGLLDIPADSEEAVDGWTWGEVREIAEFVAINSEVVA